MRTRNGFWLAALLTGFAAVAPALTRAGWEAPLPKDKTVSLQIPRLTQPPVIDGTIDAAEWREATAVSGIGGCTTNQLYARPTSYWLAWDPEHLYMAFRVWVKPGYKPSVLGRQPHSAVVFEDTGEFNWQPLGRNVPAGRTDSCFKFLINTIGNDGDFMRVSVGQQFKNWNPEFRIASRLTPPGSAPLNGRWVEVEFASTWKDFELAGPHQAGDQWKLMLGFDHMYSGWSQGRIPATSSYFDPGGYPLCTLVENAPAVQMLQESFPMAHDGMANVTLQVCNPTAKPAKVDLLAHYTATAAKTVDGKPVTEETDLLKRETTLTVAPGQTAVFKLNEKFARELGPDKGSMFLRAAQGDKELFRYFIYFQTDYPKDAHQPPPPAKTAFNLSGTFNPVRCNYALTADAYYLDHPDSAKAVRWRVLKAGDAKPVAEGVIDRAITYYFRQLISLPPLAPGDYSLEATMVLNDGKTLGPEKVEFKKLDEATSFAAWWDTKLGNTDRVIFPFSAMKREGATVACWGRSYKLNVLGLPDAVLSQGKPVTAGGARLLVVVGGKETAIPLAGEPVITGATDWRVSFTGTAKGAGLQFQVKGSVEQDGLTLLELTYAPDGQAPVKLDALRLEFPLAGGQADCLLCLGAGGNYSSRTTMLLPPEHKQGRIWSTLDTGINGSFMTVGSFYPAVWLGNEQRGLLWCADNDRGWVPANEVPAHEVIRQGKDLILRNNIIGKAFELAAPRTVTFGYMASPFRPMVKGWRAALYSEDGTFDGPNKKRKDPKTGAMIDGWAWLTPPSREPDEWSALWADYKKTADERCRAIQPFNPSLARNKYGSTVHTSLPLMGYDWKSPDTKVTGYFGPDWEGDTWNRTEQDYFLYICDRAFREGGLRTIYWDIFFNATFNNPQTGIAYELPDGRIQPGYNGLNLRRFMMRMYALMGDHGLTPGSQVSHATNDYCLIASAWMDAILDGEYHSITDESGLDWVDGYPVERMRTMSVSGQFGPQISWMNLISIKDPALLAHAQRGFADYPRLFDTWKSPNSSSDVPQPVLDWGINGEGVAYIPFWRNSFVTGDDRDILVSAWTIPGNRAVLTVFNNHRKDVKNVRLKLDLKGLGVVQKAPWLQGVVARALLGQAADFDPVEGTLGIPELVPHTMAVIGLRATEQANYDRLLPGFAAQAKLRRPQPEPAGVFVPSTCLNFGMADGPAEFAAPGASPLVAGDDPAVKVALWRLPDRVLLSVVNTDPKAEKTAVIAVDLEKLGLLPKLPWQEFIGVRDLQVVPPNRRATLDFHARKLTVPGIPPGGERLVGLRRY